MNGPMTPERIAQIDALIAELHDTWTAGRALRDLRREIDRLRALPVLRTCGECRWCHPSEVCMHPVAHAEHEIDGCALPPPSWCPLRGER